VPNIAAESFMGVTQILAIFSEFFKRKETFDSLLYFYQYPVKDVRAQIVPTYRFPFFKLATQKSNDLSLQSGQKNGVHRLRLGENMPRNLP